MLSGGIIDDYCLLVFELLDNACFREHPHDRSALGKFQKHDSRINKTPARFRTGDRLKCKFTIVQLTVNMQLVSRGRRFLLAGVRARRDKALSRADRQLTILAGGGNGEKFVAGNRESLRHVRCVPSPSDRRAGTLTLKWRIAAKGNRDTWRYVKARGR